MPHVFISYSRKDSAFVDRLEIALRGEGLLTWRDIHSIPGGAKWFRRIKQGLEASYAMLYVDTQHAEESDWVEKEFLFAASLKLPIIPVKPDARFRSLATINLNPVVCDEAHFPIGVGKIIAQLRALPQAAIVPGALAPPDESAAAPETAPLLEADYRAEIIDYARWLLIRSQADLRDALYVSLAAQTEAPRLLTRPDNPLSFGLDVDFEIGFKRLDLERIRGEDFDRSGEPVTDARVPVQEARRVVLLGEPGAGKTTT
ncbi:MAG: toll/interleukin-1 receptor domain-containing protein, partial [Anaerolineae bacterium]|nr:toll/interleukin-1 receptor domain-containing protein [Anaerolineae bacterium]